VEALFSMTSAMHMLNETVQDIRDALVEWNCPGHSSCILSHC
jgi:hypothetical protein